MISLDVGVKMSAATSCLNVVPSQFLSVVLNDNEQRSSRKLEIPKPSAASSHHPYLKENNHRLKTERKANLRQKEREREKWDQLAKLLPKALLAECTVEIHRRPFLPNRQEEKLQRLCFDARVSPVFTKPQSVLQLKRRSLQQPSSTLSSNNHHVIESEEEEEEDDEEETQQLMNENGSILTLIEAVYSDEDNSQAEEDEEEVDGDDYRPTSGKLKAIKSEPLSPLPSVSITQSTNSNSGNGIPKFKCEHCPNVYPNRGALWQHSVATHSVEKTCECKICGRKFYRNCSLALHLKSHSEEENCACKECGKSFSRLINLERHMKVHSDGVPEQLQCDLCNKLFKSQDLLQLHYQSAHSLSISCSVCGKSFANFGELMLHDATHTFEQRYICKYCKKTFSQKALLKKHVVIHTVKRLKCDKCGIEFTQRSSLLRHMKRIHSSTLNGTREETTFTNGNNTVLVHEPNVTMDVDTEDDNINEFVAVDMNEDEDDNNGSDGDDEVEDNEDEFVQEDGDNEEDDNEKFYDDIEEIELSETESIND